RRYRARRLDDGHAGRGLHHRRALDGLNLAAGLAGHRARRRDRESDQHATGDETEEKASHDLHLHHVVPYAESRSAIGCSSLTVLMRTKAWLLLMPSRTTVAPRNGLCTPPPWAWM